MRTHGDEIRLGQHIASVGRRHRQGNSVDTLLRVTMLGMLLPTGLPVAEVPHPIVHRRCARRRRIGKLHGQGGGTHHRVGQEVRYRLRAAVRNHRGYGTGHWSTNSLERLIPNLPEQFLSDALTLIGSAEVLRIELLAQLEPRLTGLAPEALYSGWREFLQVLAAHSREDVLRGLGVLIPVIHSLGGSEAIIVTFRAIQDVGRWWP